MIKSNCRYFVRKLLQILIILISRTSIKLPPIERQPFIRRPVVKVPKLLSVKKTVNKLLNGHLYSEASILEDRPPFFNGFLSSFPFLSGHPKFKIRSFARQVAEIKSATNKNIETHGYNDCLVVPYLDLYYSSPSSEV